jgi:dihydrofolate reductase
MKVILVFVSTLNGKVTRGNDPEVRHWSSRSDQKHYGRVWKDSRLIIMGSNTWNDNIIKPSAERLIIVMTRNPGSYREREIPGQVEFTSEGPNDIVKKYRSAGTELMTVVGGPGVATSFLKESLIDELWLTIEPRLFGKGISLLTESDLDLRLKLIDLVRANEDGTLITKYSIVR